jgi:hypothetical protein
MFSMQRRRYRPGIEGGTSADYGEGSDQDHDSAAGRVLGA